ncbi:MAG: EAL domain-containing protein, partial [Planctomycetaceae bacterium]|nr:EAL domain-containing protein [Planctomycetaceae bacterium]
ANGRPRVLSIRRSRHEDALTNERFNVITARDTTDELQREGKLALLADVFRSSLEGVVILDLQGRVVEANPAFSGISGVSRTEVNGLPIQTLLPWAAHSLNVAVAAAASGERWSGTVRSLGPDDRERAYLLSVSTSRKIGGQPRNIIALFSDVTEIHQTQQRLRQQAMHDNLTGLPNRRHFRLTLEEALASPSGHTGGLAVCFLDLDEFKHVNDSMGHVAGDELLILVAERLRVGAGNDACVARFGGDEFAILIPDVDLSCRKVADISNRVHKLLQRPFMVGGNKMYIGGSMGVTLFPEHADTVDELLKNADVAMYAAKASGKNRTVFFSTEMRERVRAQCQIQTDLRRAVFADEISIVFQPQIDVRNGRCGGCEALARWTLPDGRRISPAEFIPVAEKTGMIVQIGESVLLRACRQIQEWKARGLNPPRIAVNISPMQMRMHNFVDRVKQILRATETAPEELELEITENAVMEDVDEAIRVINELSELGIAIAIDDFGTGYSSLSYLRTFNVHALKIDKSFVDDLPRDRDAVAIVQSVVSLAQGRHLELVAEGVETVEQLEFLARAGCDKIQGYVFSRPLSAEECEQWLREDFQIPHREIMQPTTPDVCLKK